MTIAELFCFAFVNAQMCAFPFDSSFYQDRRTYVPGCNITNTIIFAPWIVLNYATLVAYLLAKTGVVPGVTLKVVFSTVAALGLTQVTLHPFARIDVLLSVIQEILTKDFALIIFMALVLALGLSFISMWPVGGIFEQRKMFHVLAFLLFLPPIALASYSEPRMLAFAFNLVIVAMLVVEGARFKRILPGCSTENPLDLTEFDKWIKSYCQGFERREDTLITTHILLLIGCAYPFLQAFIMLNGSVFP